MPMVVTVTHRAVLVFLLCLGSSPLPAAEMCDNPVTPTEIAECTDREAETAEQELNRVYQQVMKGLAKEEAQLAKLFPDRPAPALRAALIAAEKEWLKYREHSCRLVGLVVLGGNPSRGDPEAISVTACNAQYARARIEELKKFAQAYDISLGP